MGNREIRMQVNSLIQQVFCGGKILQRQICLGSKTQEICIARALLQRLVANGHGTSRIARLQENERLLELFMSQWVESNYKTLSTKSD
jgi:hypothetical protein